MPDLDTAALRALAQSSMAGQSLLAADEIDRLRAQLSEASAALGTALADAVADDALIADLRAQVTALTPILAAWDGFVRPRLVVDAIVAPLNAPTIHVRLRAEGAPILHTCYARIGVRNGVGTNTGDGVNQAKIAPLDYAVWRAGPDESPEAWLTLDARPIQGRHVEGNFFEIVVNGRGFDYSTISQTKRVMFSASAPPMALPAVMPYHRPGKRLDLSAAKPTAVIDPATFEVSNTGLTPDGRQCWRAQLPHGGEQTGNGEKGYYARHDPALGVDAPIQVVPDSEGVPVVRLRSRRLPAPFVIENRSYNHQAAAIHSKSLDAWCARFGLWLMTAKLPDRPGAWPAFWAHGRYGWPPEIDFLEWEMNWQMGSGHISSGQHWGGFGRDRVGSENVIMEPRRLGMGPVNVHTAYHTYASVVTEDGWVYHFLDGIEVNAHRNFAVHEKGEEGWGYLTIINVGVKTTAAQDAYATGSGDMDIRRAERHDAGSGFVLA